MVEKIDRRIMRTEQALQEALISLILKKSYPEITVQDILDEANLGRSTFYAHYRDKDDLLLRGFGRLFQSFEDEFSIHHGNAQITAQEFSLFFLRHTGQNRPLFKALIGKPGGESIEQAARKYMSGTIQKFLESQYPHMPPNLPLDLVVHFVVSSYLAVLSWWLEQDTPSTPEEMNALFWRLAWPGVQTVMGNDK